MNPQSMNFIIKVHGGIRHLEMLDHQRHARFRVHGGIRHLER